MDYQEQLLKAKAYESIINQLLIDRNQFPTTSMVNNILEKVDLRYSLLKHKMVDKDSLFDVDEFNKEMYYMYIDILILYQAIVIYETEKYSQLETDVAGYISSLQEVADSCERLTKYHTESTGLGTTILYEDKNFCTSLNDNSATITLHGIKAEPRSDLTCFIDGLGFDDYNVIFNFYQGEQIVYCSSSSRVSKRPYRVEAGQLNVSRKAFKVNDSLLDTNRTFQITNVEDVSENKIYKIYGGKNKIYIEKADNKLPEKNGDLSFLVPAYSSVRFFLKNPTYLNFEFSEEPIYKNFSQYQNASITSETTEIEFTAGENPIVFNFLTDGELYAEKLDVNIVNDKLYATKKNTVTDLLLETIEFKAPISFDKIEVIIDNIDRNIFHINSIAIKQQSTLRE